MEKEFIPYEEALVMKELGFDEPCFGWYMDNIDMEVFIEHIKRQPCADHETDCLAPIYQQAFRWFRKNYNLFHEITLDTYSEPNRLYVEIRKLDNSHTFVSKDFRLSHIDNDKYEEAELNCLRRLIEIVKQ